MTTDTTNESRRKDDVHPTRELTWAEPAPAGAQLADVMIDTETLGTTPGSAILSIGAVMFGPAGLGEEFYAPISLVSCIEAGLTIDPGTVAWWMKQSDAARAAAFRDDAESLQAVLEQFTCWLNLVDAERPWAHGANFDPPLLEAAYRACGMTPPWKFWNARDTRTLYDLAGVRVDRARGTHHNALDDARVQAEAAVIALQRMRNYAADAARYRHLRENMKFSEDDNKLPVMTLQAPIPAPGHDFHRDWINDRFDASVDATVDRAIAVVNAEDGE